MISIARNDNRRVKQIVSLYFKHMAILEINITQMEASETLFAFVVLISQFLENDMFSIEMDPCMQFRSSKGLEKHWLLKIN